MDYVYEKKSKKPMIISFIVLGVIIIGLVIYVILDLKINHKKEENNEIIINDISFDLNNLYKIDEILKKFDIAFNNEDSTFYGYPYKERKIAISEFDNSAAKFLILKNNMIPTQNKSNAKFISEIKIKSDFENIFGKNLEYKASDIEAGDNFVIKYDSNTLRYAYYFIDNNQSLQSGISTINYKTKIEEGKIIVTRKVFYIEYVVDENGTISTANIYNDISKSKKLGTINVTKTPPREKELLAKFSNSLSEYEFIFLENQEGINYNLDKIVKIK